MATGEAAVAPPAAAPMEGPTAGALTAEKRAAVLTVAALVAAPAVAALRAEALEAAAAVVKAILGTPAPIAATGIRLQTVAELGHLFLGAKLCSTTTFSLTRRA